MQTQEGAFQFEHSLDHCVEFFSKAGSIYDTPSRKPFYGNGASEDILSLFQRAWISNKEVAFKLLLWVRDCRGGAGNRSGFRKCLRWLATRQGNDHKWVDLNLSIIPELGRWDDLRTLFNSKSESFAVSLWKDALVDRGVLAAKWAKRTDIPLYLSLKEHGIVGNLGDFRRLLSGIRSEHIVETKMCSKEWKEIEYKKVPSVAMSRYSSAFFKNDEDGFTSYKESLEKGETKINASVLFPHDCVRTAKGGDKQIADAQFEALPNYIGDNKGIMVISDSSGSMEQGIGGSVTAYDVSCALALYCSNNVPKESPFYRKFIQFCSESKFSDWEGMKFSDALDRRSRIFDGAVGSTRIDKALDLLLKTAKMFNVADENMPKMLLICSDMQFHQGVRSVGEYGNSVTEVEKSLQKWDKVGYSRPVIVYWNLCPYSGQPDTVEGKNIALVSGFSPSVLKSILACDDFSPIAVMMKALEKYNIVVPE